MNVGGCSIIPTSSTANCPHTKDFKPQTMKVNRSC